jgi:hypothetical protein
VVLPAWVIDAVAQAPGGSRPSHSLGITERDKAFYREWDAISRDRDRDRFRAWMDAQRGCLGDARAGADQQLGERLVVRHAGIEVAVDLG